MVVYCSPNVNTLMMLFQYIKFGSQSEEPPTRPQGTVPTSVAPPAPAPLPPAPPQQQQQAMPQPPAAAPAPPASAAPGAATSSASASSSSSSTGAGHGAIARPAGRPHGVCTCSHITLRKKATIHQVTTILATSKNGLFPGHNHLLTTGT